MTVSPYLTGAYTPVPLSAESADWEPASVVKGEIPEEICGYFLRNSSNPAFAPSGQYHWFDGDGFIQGVKFKGGRAWFKGKFIQTDKLKRELSAGMSLSGGINMPISLNDLPRSLARLFKFAILGHNPFENTSNTDLVYYDGKLISTWMLGGDAYQIDLETLETIGKCVANSDRRPLHLSAHAKIHPGDRILYGMEFTKSWRRFSGKKIVLSSLGKDGLNSKEISIAGRRLLHDMGVTENYIVILDMPAEVGVTGVKYGHDLCSRFGVVPKNFRSVPSANNRGESEAIWFEDPSGFYVIHVINAYEEDGAIVVWGLRKPYLATEAEDPDDDESAMAVFDAYLHKWTLDLSSGEIRSDGSGSWTDHFPLSCEFPTINEGWLGRKNQFSYLPGIARERLFAFDTLSKFDHLGETYLTRKAPSGCYYGEAQFIADKARRDVEDAGWLVTFVHDLRAEPNRTYVEIIDAQDFLGPAVAKIALPRYVPFGFHTTYVEQ